MSYEIKRTDAEIDEQLNKAADGINDGSQYPGMSYEDGIQQFWLWVTGEPTTHHLRTKGRKAPETNAGVLPFICEREQTVGNAAKKP